MVDNETFRRVVDQLDKNDISLQEALKRQAGFLQAMHQQQSDDLRKKALKELSDSITKNASHQYDTAAKYTNLVILAGYASFFTIWNGTRNSIKSESIYMLSALLIGISAMFFCFF